MSIYSYIGKLISVSGTIASIAAAFGLAGGIFWQWYSHLNIEITVREYALKYTMTYCLAKAEQRNIIRDKIFTTEDGKVFLQANCDVFDN